MNNKGIVFNVQRYTIHDGPGLRTEFFLKGCPLRCEWCSNPESQKVKIEVGVYTKRCITDKKCGGCLEVCPNPEMLNFNEQGKLVSIDYKKCIGCLACVKECPSDALKQWGEVMTIEDCMKEIRKDKGYYERSGVGVTVSGGDPLVQVDFVAALFEQCQREGYHTCLESDFYGEWESVEKVLPCTDLFIADIKHMNGEVHKTRTGVSNTKILNCLKKLAEQGKPIILRIPVIPRFNDDMKNMEETADFIIKEMKNKVRTLQLLSYMRLGEEKYESLNRPYPMRGYRMNRPALQKRIQKYADYFNGRGIHCVVGTREVEENRSSDANLM